jgi:cytochrome P450
MNLLRRWLGKPPPPPLSQTIDLADPAVSIDPFPAYEQLRREGDVVYLRRHGAWLVLSYEAARQVFAAPQHFSSLPYRFVDTAMLSVDPPAHGPVRRVVGRAFGSETLKRLEAEAEESAAELIRDQMEVVTAFARPLSRRIAASLLGVDSEAVEAIARAEADSAGAAEPFPLVCAAIDSVAGRAGLMTALLSDGVIGEEEALSLVRLLWLASTATSERTIAHCILRLAEDPDLLARLRGDPRLVPAFVEEVLRLNPPENLILRSAVASVTVAGAAIPAGASVQICLPAANRDPARFEAPETLRLDRAAGHLSFGSGIHQCVGGPLTRRVVTAAMRVFIARAETLRISGEVEWLHAMVVRAPSSMWVTL